MIKWLYLLFCKVGIHNMKKSILDNFGPGGSTETIKCKDCGIKKLEKGLKIFQVPEAETTISLLLEISQFIKTSVLVFFNILIYQ